ncbi:PhzF family phenazine biosynthesis protein [Kribbella sandramycini]|uniref:PhzF family phenazine biosynthesis protein n=1 Tax=Kribbella sandramycini TaxID=60450 RepID=A0A7Y4NYU0_9ACTN|nr:PhzF family phenazine biosynthesis protein [Kribbella sandramycini]MBB6568132.1 PhzF family phenazine biosynthesis protein [Kribbella sandramycini]NOL39274.1 PhzF family phenazine biosynthesis protein [Kribbella sandramycini]
MQPRVELVRVFPEGPAGGNPAPIVLDAAGMSDAQMQAVARSSGHESGFVVPASAASGADFGLRFWVPNHEMSMCGHATVGAVWLLDREGLLPRDDVRIETLSGLVAARVVGRQVEVSQPAGVVEAVPDDVAAAVAGVLGITAAELAAPLQNARTSRVKTLVPLASVEALDGLQPDFGRVEAVCAALGSTGLYPYAVGDAAGQVFHARQFPRSSGYPEDAATGIAAAALCFGLLEQGRVRADETPIHVRQGQAMGSPSRISLRFRLSGEQVDGIWLGGRVELAAGDAVR